MITAYGSKSHPITDLKEADDRVRDATWLDAVGPTKEDIAILEDIMDAPIPSRDEITEIETTSRLFHRNGVAFVTLSHIIDVDAGRPRLTPATFILSQNRLITLRDAGSRAFDAYSSQWNSEHSLPSPSVILSELLNAIVERAADVIEGAQSSVNRISEQLLTDDAQPITGLAGVVRSIGQQQMLVSFLQESLIELERSVSFISALPKSEYSIGGNRLLKSVLRDCRALRGHANFMANNLSFLLQAAHGLINERQNDTIKLLSVISILFLPPTLLASIYGMNFVHMPGLKHELGFPIAVIAMLISSVAPLLIAKRWRWL